jgi:hypothetical protein
MAHLAKLVEQEIQLGEFKNTFIKLSLASLTSVTGTTALASDTRLDIAQEKSPKNCQIEQSLEVGCLNLEAEKSEVDSVNINEVNALLLEELIKDSKKNSESINRTVCGDY